jgi:hypothetical protein
MNSEGPSPMFKNPLKISKKRPDVHPAMGDYDQTHYTIQNNFQKKRDKYSCMKQKYNRNSEPNIGQFENESRREQNKD